MAQGKKSHRGDEKKHANGKHANAKKSKHSGSKRDDSAKADRKHKKKKKGDHRDRPSTRATAALAKSHVDFKVLSYQPDPSESSYGMDAAYALDVEPHRVYKTLIADVDGELVVGLVRVDRALDLKALANAVGGRRAEMADPNDAERASGYVLGGISPVAMRKPLPTVLDTAATDQSTIMVSGGKRGLEIQLSPEDLISVTGARVAPISRRQ